MNSVLGIGENIIFINKGNLEWTGTSKDVFTSDNQELNDFVFATNLFKNAKNYMLQQLQK